MCKKAKGGDTKLLGEQIDKLVYELHNEIKMI